MAAKKTSTKKSSKGTAKKAPAQKKKATKKVATSAKKKAIAQPKPETAHIGKETVPEFVDVKERNLRNSFGLSHTTDFDKRLAEINKRLEHHAKKHGTHHSHHATRQKRKLHKPHFFRTVLIATLLVIFVIAFGGYMAERTVVDGQCSVKITTYSDGAEEVQFTPLPGTSCSSVQDCRDVLRDRNFPDDEIARMEIRCG